MTTKTKGGKEGKEVEEKWRGGRGKETQFQQGPGQRLRTLAVAQCNFSYARI
jgi:hypothetical protein